MTCQFARETIGNIVRITTSENTNCDFCGYTYSYSAKMVYMGHKEIKGVLCDWFVHLETHNCPECSTKQEAFRTPCGSAYILQLVQASELIDIV